MDFAFEFTVFVLLLFLDKRVVENMIMTKIYDVLKMKLFVSSLYLEIILNQNNHESPI